MQLRTKAFEDGGEIPRKYTCEGDDVSPDLSWTNYPAGTKTFALIMEDPDAPVGIFTHWIIYNIPLNVTSLNEGIEKKANLINGIKQGKNDFGKFGYNGPCPPIGHGYHRYYFKLFALSTEQKFKEGLKREQFYGEIEKYIVGKTEIMGKFKRE